MIKQTDLSLCRERFFSIYRVVAEKTEIQMGEIIMATHDFLEDKALCTPLGDRFRVEQPTASIAAAQQNKADSIISAEKENDANGEIRPLASFGLGLVTANNKAVYKHDDVIPIKDGGTGGTTAETARTNLGAAAINHTHADTASHTHTASSIGAAAENHIHTPSDIGAASSGHTHASLTPTQLTKEDLNTILEIGDYFAGGSNTCTNKPDGLPADIAFGLKVMKVASSGLVQVFITSSGTLYRNNDVYIRSRVSAQWTEWAQFYNSLHLPDIDVLGGLSNAGGTVSGTLILANTRNANLVYNNPALVIGGTPEQKHMEIDSDEIKALIGNAGRVSEPGQLSLNPNGGNVLINGKMAYKKGDLIPVSDGGTGVTSIAALKDALGIADSGWITLPLASGVTSSDTANRVPSYRKVGNRVYIEGVFQVTPSTSTITVATIPSGYRPKNTIHFFTALSSTRIARVYVSHDGYINLEWAINIGDASKFTSSTWIDINVDYYVD